MTDAPLLRVRAIRVEGLFGLYDHDIPLNQEQRVTILHGPNGVGKTVLLRMTHGLFTGRVSELSRVPFRRFEVELSNGVRVTVTQSSEQDPEPGRSLSRLVRGWRPAPLIHVTQYGGDSERLQFGDGRSGPLPRSAERILMEMGARPVRDDVWRDPSTGDLVYVWDLMERYLPQRAGPGDELDPPARPLFAALAEQVGGALGVHMIETQRLVRAVEASGFEARARGRPSLDITVEVYAQALARELEAALARYGSVSQSLDQSFPQRLLATRDPLSPEALTREVAQLDAQRARLTSLGILDPSQAAGVDPAKLGELDDSNRRVMTLYVSDTAKKLEVLEDLSERVGLLVDNINGKFTQKRLQVDRAHGFQVIGHDGRPLPLDALSSGEQHELVLLYDLLFHIKPNTLVLIDEPELSLHVVWQKRFMRDLLSIAETTGLDALVATHSPFIVGDYEELMVDLRAEIAG